MSLVWVALVSTLSACGEHDRAAAHETRVAPAQTRTDGGRSNAARDGGSASPSVAPDAGAGTSVSGAWVAPIGVPTPSFGIEENAPATPSPWTSATSGWFYVCPSCAGATDAGNDNGLPAKPRRTIPSPLTAGSVVVLSGTFDDDASFVANGTATAPVFVRSEGAARAKITANQTIRGSYVIVENVEWAPASADDADFGVWLPEGSDHIVIRHSELSGNAQRAGGIGLGSWEYSGSEVLSDVVLHDNRIHDLGDVTASFDQDAHCIAASGSVDRLWITYNTLERCSGDGVQLEARTGRSAFVRNVYIAKNLSRDHRQTGAWVKHASDVVISENVFSGFGPSSGGPGACTGFQYGPERVWILFNDLSKCPIGVNIGDNDASGNGLTQYVIGNLIHDVHDVTGTNVYGQGGIIVRAGTHVTVANNTIYASDSGINVMAGVTRVDIENNIVSHRDKSGPEYNDLYVSSDALVGTFAQNLFFAPSGNRFSWDGSSTTALGALRCVGCKTGDPLFVDAAKADFALGAGSPARSSGSASAAYAAFKARYGIDIAVDASGNPRPASAAWNIGAY